MGFQNESYYVCECCGEEHNGSYGSGRFCCKKCARSFATKNKRKEINEKVKETLRNRFNTNDKYCTICNKKLRRNNITGYCLNCIRTSDELKEYRSEKSKKGGLKNKNYKGWMSRNITSYPEKFWIKVLDNNDIKYEHNKPIKRNDGHCYFLDFCIIINNTFIDLEIDGKQHKYEDRTIHDNERNKYLESIGFLVYRIEWNEINSDKGKLLMKEKIDKFLEFYRKLNLCVA